MGVTTNLTNKPINPRGNDQSPKGYNRASLFSGKALDFDGVNDYIDVPYLDSLANTGVSSTLSFYFNTDTLGSTDVLFEQRGTSGSFRYVVWIDANNNSFNVYFNSLSANISTTIVETNKWYHFVSVVDGSEGKMYINGQLIGSTSYTPFLSETTCYFGNQPTANQYFDGSLANAKIFNTALTAAQVADLYNNPEKIVPTGVADSALKLWLPMQEGAGTTAYDGSGNGNHGTISGATWTHGIGAPVAQTAVIDWNKGQNLYTYSEKLNESDWATQGISISTDNATAPNGTNTAEKVIPDTTNVFHLVYQSFSVTNGISYRVSLFAKAGGYNFLLPNTTSGSSQGNSGPIVDLSNGTIAGNHNYDYGASVTDAGNGWYKIEYDFTTSSTSARIDFNQFPTSSVASYSGNGSDGVYIWGASLRPASSGSTYVPTLSTAQTSDVLLPQGLTTGRDITGVNLFENVRKQGALNLDGNSWAEVHDNASLDITDAITLEAWVYNSGENNKGLLGRWFNGTQCYMLYKPAADNNFNFYINSNYVTSGTVTARDWHHVVGVYDGATKKIYVNGVEEGSSAETATINTSSDPIEIGRFFGGPDTRTLANQLAQPRIYNRALTAEEVQRNYDAGKNIYK